MTPKEGVEVVVIGFSFVVVVAISVEGAIETFGASVTVDRPNTGTPLGNVRFAFGNDAILVVTPNTGLVVDTTVSVAVVAIGGVIPTDRVTELLVVVAVGIGVSFVVIVNNGKVLELVLMIDGNCTMLSFVTERIGLVIVFDIFSVVFVDSIAKKIKFGHISFDFERSILPLSFL